MYSVVADRQKFSFDTVNHLYLGVGCLSHAGFASPETISKPLTSLTVFCVKMGIMVIILTFCDGFYVK